MKPLTLLSRVVSVITRPVRRTQVLKDLSQAMGQKLTQEAAQNRPGLFKALDGYKLENSTAAFFGGPSPYLVIATRKTGASAVRHEIRMKQKWRAECLWRMHVYQTCITVQLSEQALSWPPETVLESLMHLLEEARILSDFQDQIQQAHQHVRFKELKVNQGWARLLKD